MAAGLWLALAAGAAGAQANPFGVYPGDEMEIRIFTQTGEPLLAVAGTRYVDRDGRVFLPFVGSVSVSGLDTAGIREEIASRFSSFFQDPVVDVSVRLRVNITGAVRTPGHYFLVPGSTIQDAISLAGGAGSDLQLGGTAYGAADLGNARLVRGDSVRIIDIRANVDATADTREMVLSGDWIFVPTLPRARFRENLQLVSSIITLVASAVALVILVQQ